MNEEHTRRACRQRQRYPDRGRAVLGIQVQVDRGSAKAGHLRPYRCSACGGWHVKRSVYPSGGKP